MKDFIVLLATVVLGVVLAGLVLVLKDTATNLNTKAVKQVTDLFSVEEVYRA